MKQKNEIKKFDWLDKLLIESMFPDIVEAKKKKKPKQLEFFQCVTNPSKSTGGRAD